ncbi:MAG: S4 domain-containing protein, partial [Pseudomonadota bacterium]
GANRAAGPAAEAERVQKILARAGLASRREAEEWIRQGRITINGEPAALGSRALGNDQIRLDGRLVRQASTVQTATYLCHRSPGESLREPREGDERTALAERLPSRTGKRFIAVSPMPRMDGGLELLTSDGALAERLQRVVRRMELGFSLRVRGELLPEQVAAILKGELDSGQHLQVQSVEPAGGEGANRWYQVVTTGANGRDLRSLVERQGAVLSRVLRVKFGALDLTRALPRGQARALDAVELEGLLAVE